MNGETSVTEKVCRVSEVTKWKHPSVHTHFLTRQKRRNALPRGKLSLVATACIIYRRWARVFAPTLKCDRIPTFLEKEDQDPAFQRVLDRDLALIRLFKHLSK